MVQWVEITNFLGETLHINFEEADPDHGLLITNIDGLGPVKADILRTNLATRDGSKINGARANERNIVMTLMYVRSPLIEDSRQRTYRFFPLKKPLTFTIKTDNRLLETVGYVESNEPEIFSDQETAQISIICADPWFYDAEYGSQMTEFYGVTPLFEFPFENDSLTDNLIEFGNIELLTSRLLTNYGEADVGIDIYIKILNTVGDITIYKLDTNERMSISSEKISNITGSGFSPNDEIHICTISGMKCANLLREGVTYNILNALDKYSDWFMVTPGDNIFTYETDVLSAINITIVNRIAFEGI